MNLLVLDIETGYLLTGTWGLYNQNIGVHQILDGGKVLSYAAKWVGKRPIVFARHTEPNFLEVLHIMLSQADAVITFNGRRFDIPMLNREFLKAGLPPPAPFKHIDLIETVKKHFRFPSNKLDWVLKELGLGKKMEHEGFPLWTKVLNGDEKAWATMERYNIADVRLTERLYFRIRSWISSHPNYNLFSDSGFLCPTCGSSHVQKRGTYHTQTQTYQRYQCNKCGSWSRSRMTEVPKEKRAGVLIGAGNG